MDGYLRCGILDHGFLILSCEGCGEKLPVAFSCKRRARWANTIKIYQKSV
jgi:hypothetical protein